MAGTSKDGHELVPAPPHHQVAWSNGLLKHTSHQPQGLVAGIVTVAIVDAFQLVDINQNDRHRLGGIPSFEPGAQCLPGGAAGQRVGLRESEKVAMLVFEIREICLQQS